MRKRSMLKAILVLIAPIVVTALLVVLFITIDNVTFSKAINLSLIVMFLVLFVLYYYYVAVQLCKTLKKHFSQLDKIAEGNIRDSIKLKDSLILPSETINKFVDKIRANLSNTLYYIQSISKGELNVEYELLSSSDEIGTELMKLQGTLKEDKAELEKNKIEEDRRNWIASGLAKFSDILRQDSNDMAKMGYTIISNLVDYANLNQGGLFVLEENDDDGYGGDVYYEMIATVAYDRKKVIKDKIKIGESLVGRCAYERKTIYMSKIPVGYMNITSGLGTANPTNLLIVPCVLDEKVLAVIEVASFNSIEKYQIEFIEKLGESIASSIANVKTNERTKILLQGSQHQSEELAAQEEELRQNLEEMEATQDELRRQMELNGAMHETLTKEKFLFDALLEYSPVRINYKDRDNKFIKASRSLLVKFGKQNYEDIVGLTEFDFATAVYAQRVMDDDKELMRNRKARIDSVEYEVKNDGTELWKNVSKVPLITEQDECVGIMSIVYDLTELKLNEQDNIRLKAANRSMRNILLSQHYSIIFNNKGVIMDVSPSLCKLYGIKADEVKGKNIISVLIESHPDNRTTFYLIEQVIEKGFVEINNFYSAPGIKVNMKQQFTANEIAKNEYEIIMIGIIE